MVPGAPYRPKDFALVKHDGLYHLFYIRHNTLLADGDTENDLGHAVSADLWNWEQAPPVVPARDTSWDRTHIWAPSIVEQNGTFYLFYTGVSTITGVCDTWQRIGVATSTDLYQWTQMDAPVLACTAVPWTVCDSTVSSTAFRDPFVMADPVNPGQWLMYYSTFPSSDPGGMVVGMASSAGDPASWSDTGPLWITNRAYSYNTIVESAHLFQHDSLWYLFFTTNAGQPISWATGSSPTGAPGTWTYRGRLATLLGVDTQAWYASEHLQDGLVDYFAYVIGDRISVKQMAWDSLGTFSLVQPPLMHVRSLAWDAASTMEDSTVTLTIVAANWGYASASLEGLQLRADGSEVPVSLDSLGLPATVPLTGDTTRVTWTARWLPDPSDTTRTLHLLVRLADRTAVAPALAVVSPPPLEVTALGWSAGTVADGDTVTLAIAARYWEGHSAQLTAERLRDGGATVPMSPDSLGLPATVALTGDTTWVSWVARWLPDEPDTARLLRLVVRSADPEAAAEPLVIVGPELLQVQALAWDGEEVAEGDTATLAIVTRNWGRRSLVLAAERILASGVSVAVSLDSLGLPAQVALTADTTRLSWAARWLPDEPDTARLLRLVMRAADSSAVAGPLLVVGPEALQVDSLLWDGAAVAEGDSAALAIVARNWRLRSVGLETLRLRSDSSQVPLPVDSLGLPATVALTGDTTIVRWRARWLPDEPDTARLLRLVVRTADSSAVAEPLDVVGPEPVVVASLAWDGAEAAPGDTVTLSIMADNWSRRSIRLEALRLRSDGALVPLAADSLGLPQTVYLTGFVTTVSWVASWLPDEPDTARLLRIVVRTTDSTVVAEPLTVVGPERPLRVLAFGWSREEAANGDSATLAIVAQNWAGRGVDLEAYRLRGDSTFAAIVPDSLGLPGTVALSGDTTRVDWTATWLPDEPDTARLLRLVVRVADPLAQADPLVVVGPGALVLESLGWDRAVTAEGDTATLAIAAQNWLRRSVPLQALRLRPDSTLLPIGSDPLGLPGTVALTGDTTRLRWAATWLPDDPDTARLLRLVVRTSDSSLAAEPLAVVGPEPVVVASLAWESAVVAEGDTAMLAIVAQNWSRRSLRLEALRLRCDSTLVPLPSDSLGLPVTVALTGDTTRVGWKAAWQPDEPDTTRLLRVVVRTDDAGAAAEPLAVIGPERPLRVLGMAWDRAEVAEADTAFLAIVSQNGAGRAVALAAERLLAGGGIVGVSLDSLGLPGTVALTGDTTRVPWAAAWLPDEPDTARLLRLVVRLADSSMTTGPLVVVGPEALVVEWLGWDAAEVAEGDTASLAIVAANWRLRSATLRGWRERCGGMIARLVPIALDTLGLAEKVALTGDTTRVRWAAAWLADEPDTARLLRLVVGLADSTVMTEPLVVVGPERPLRVLAMDWESAEVADGEMVTLRIVAENWAEQGLNLAALRLRGDTTLVALPLESLGLPEAVELTGDTTRVDWTATWLADEPDTARLLRLVVQAVDLGNLAVPLTVVGPERPLRVLALMWDSSQVTRGDEATLAVVAQNWAGQSIALEAFRRRSDESLVPLSLDTLGLGPTVALIADTTRIAWTAVWLPDEPDTTLPLWLVVRTSDSSAVAKALIVIGPPWPPDSLVAVPGADLPAGLALEGVIPTPARGSPWIVLTLPTGRPATLALMDVAGRRVWTRDLGGLGAGRHFVRLDAGRDLPGGVYFVRLQQGDSRRVAKVVILR